MAMIVGIWLGICRFRFIWPMDCVSGFVARVGKGDAAVQELILEWEQEISKGKDEGELFSSQR